MMALEFTQKMPIRPAEITSPQPFVGVVTTMRPVRLADGSTGAELTLELDRAHGDLPKDSTLRIRPRSALGLKYVEVNKGTSPESFRSGDTVPASQAAAATELDEVYEMFDAPTRDAGAGEPARLRRHVRRARGVGSAARSRSCRP